MNYEVDFEKTLEDAFLSYSASVAQERAIPDVRDGLKIGLRQGLYAQYTGHLTHNDKFQKAQKSVSLAMSQSYIHGDAAMYDTFIRAAKPFAYRYPLEEAQGSYGSPAAPDDQSAPRYVEMRASELSNYFFEGLKKEAIDKWYNNYDDTELIPTVFPSIGFWNIVNGSSGIAVSFSTSIPSFNLREVNNALIALIQNPDVEPEKIYCPPDFATGGIIINEAETKQSILKGSGTPIRIRAKMEYDSKNKVLIATELPYGVYTNTIMEQLKTLTEKNENYGIDKIIDHTKKTAEIRIYPTKGTDIASLISRLYQDTDFESSFPVNMIMLDNGCYPKVFSWKDACEAYITHIRDCKQREVKFDLKTAQARENILNGLLIATANIDKVVSIIRNAENKEQASAQLISAFNFNQPQVDAILDLKLQRLIHIEAVKIEKELSDTRKLIERCNELLTIPAKLDSELIKLLREVSNKFGDERRTTFKSKEHWNDVLTRTCGLIVENLKIRKSNTPQAVQTPNDTPIYLFTNKGRMYLLSKDSLPETSRLVSPDNYVKMVSGERTTCIALTGKEAQYICVMTRKGIVKKMELSYCVSNFKQTTLLIGLAENDEVVSTFFLNDNETVLAVSHNGFVTRFNIDNIVPVQSKLGRGAAGMTFKSSTDYVISAEPVQKEHDNLVLFYENNTIKRVSLSQFEKQNRGGKGVLATNASTFISNTLLINSKRMTKYNNFPLRNRTEEGDKYDGQNVA